MKFHGAPERFEAVAELVGKYFDTNKIKYVLEELKIDTPHRFALITFGPKLKG